MLKYYRSMQFASQQQFWLLIISIIVLFYSLLNLTIKSKIISSGFIILALLLFIVALRNWRVFRIQMKINRIIRYIQKEYGFIISDANSSFIPLNSTQKKLWQYIVSDYPIDELQQIFSCSIVKLAKEIKNLADSLEKNCSQQ